MSSVAREFFDSICGESQPYTKLASLVGSTPPTFEGDWLDFKGGAQLSDEALKVIWSKALSGFANTGAGVLVFGIDARKDKTTGIDCAGALSLVTDALTLKSRLLELHTTATDPPVQGVQVEAILVESSARQGFVICLVPQSVDRPHRAEYASRQYYIRCGDDFLVPSVSLLRTLFYPYARTRIEPSLIFHGPETSGLKLIANIFLRNAGTLTAHDVFVRASHDRSVVALMGLPAEVLQTNAIQNPYSLVVSPPIHPGQDCHLLQLSFNESNSFEKALRFEMSIFCRDSEPMKWIFDCRPDDLTGKRIAIPPSNKISLLQPAEN